MTTETPGLFVIKGPPNYACFLEPWMQSFTYEDLVSLSDEQIINRLKAFWGYQENEPIIMVGRIKQTTNQLGKIIYWIEKPHNPTTGKPLEKAFKNRDSNLLIHIGQSEKIQSSTSWIKSTVTLSPLKVRESRKDPCALSSIESSIELLETAPPELINATISIEDQKYIEQWIIDEYRKKLKDKKKEIYKNLITEQRETEAEISRLKEKQIKLTEELASQEIEKTKIETQTKLKIELVKKDLENINKKIETKQNNFSSENIKMQHKLASLEQFIEQKSKTLLDLDLIDSDLADGLNNPSTNSNTLPHHDFFEAFDGNIQKTISYIQAHLYNQGIIYQRATLENFFSLIQTHDLIILAGDSGSGKTNLVKSFAKAIGGKSFIIPVKPNWTSAEDLVGYYNPLEQKFLSTPFLEALMEASRNPKTPYFICLDEMNLARVEYYFADFLSLLEERNQAPKIKLYSNTESENLHSETRNFIALIDEAKSKLENPDSASFLDILKNEQTNTKLHELCGFRENESLLRYHAHLRKLVSNSLKTPSELAIPENVRIIGAINIDETTHYLSPKILDRAHIIRFNNPLLTDWNKIEQEIEKFDLDLSLPIHIDSLTLGKRSNYPDFDRNDPLTAELLKIAIDYLEPLGIEFGLRTIRQSHNYKQKITQFTSDEKSILDNIILQKILPKFVFDGEKFVNEKTQKKDILESMHSHIKSILSSHDIKSDKYKCIAELARTINNAKANDWMVNYWYR